MAANYLAEDLQAIVFAVALQDAGQVRMAARLAFMRRDGLKQLPFPSNAEFASWLANLEGIPEDVWYDIASALRKTNLGQQVFEGLERVSTRATSEPDAHGGIVDVPHKSNAQNNHDDSGLPTNGLPAGLDSTPNGVAASASSNGHTVPAGSGTGPVRRAKRASAAALASPRPASAASVLLSNDADAGAASSGSPSRTTVPAGRKRQRTSARSDEQGTRPGSSRGAGRARPKLQDDVEDGGDDDGGGDDDASHATPTWNEESWPAEYDVWQSGAAGSGRTKAGASGSADAASGAVSRSPAGRRSRALTRGAVADGGSSSAASAVPASSAGARVGHGVTGSSGIDGLLGSLLPSSRDAGAAAASAATAASSSVGPASGDDEAVDESARSRRRGFGRGRGRWGWSGRRNAAWPSSDADPNRDDVHAICDTLLQEQRPPVYKHAEAGASALAPASASASGSASATRPSIQSAEPAADGDAQASAAGGSASADATPAGTTLPSPRDAHPYLHGRERLDLRSSAVADYAGKRKLNHHYAALFRKVVDGKKDVNIRDSNGRTMLRVACEDGDVKLASALIRLGADTGDDTETSAVGHELMEAAGLQGDMGIYHLLLGPGDGTIRDFQDADVIIGRAVHAAVRGETGAMAIHHLADSKWRTNEGREADVLKEQERVTIADLLISRGCPVDEPWGQDKWTPLMVAAQNGRTVLMEFLMHKGADPSKRTIHNANALIMLCSSPWLDGVTVEMLESVLEALVAWGPAATAAGSSSAAAGSGARSKSAGTSSSSSKSKAVVDSPAMDINARDENGFCALSLAVEANQLDLVRVLLKHDARADCVDNDGTTILHAALSSSPAMLELVLGLIERKATGGMGLDTADNAGHTALHVAGTYAMGPAVARLLRAGADATRQDQDGNTPLHLACMQGQHLKPPVSTDMAVAYHYCIRLLLDGPGSTTTLDPDTPSRRRGKKAKIAAQQQVDDMDDGGAGAASAGPDGAGAAGSGASGIQGSGQATADRAPTLTHSPELRLQLLRIRNKAGLMPIHTFLLSLPLACQRAGAATAGAETVAHRAKHGLPLLLKATDQPWTSFTTAPVDGGRNAVNFLAGLNLPLPVAVAMLHVFLGSGRRAANVLERAHSGLTSTSSDAADDGSAGQQDLVNIQDDNGWTALHHAAWGADAALIKHLLQERGAKPTIVTTRDVTREGVDLHAGMTAQEVWSNSPSVKDKRQRGPFGPQQR